MQLQFIAKYKKSHLVTRKKTSYNLSQKITVLAIFCSRKKVPRNCYSIF